MDGFESLQPEPPFIWPEPRVSEGVATYQDVPPIEKIVLSSSAVMGIITAPSEKGVHQLHKWLHTNEELKAKLIIALYPTCLTKQGDLSTLKSLTEEYKDRLEIRIEPYRKVIDRPTNVTCFYDSNASNIYMMIGSTEDLGLLNLDGQINFVFKAGPFLFNSFNNYFTLQWAKSGEGLNENVLKIPELVLPEGSAEAAQAWADYCGICANTDKAEETKEIDIDAETGEVSILDQGGTKVPSPGEEIGFPKSERLALIISSLYEKGSLVNVSKHSRIPPLDAPFDPSWFGDFAKIQHGHVTRKVSMRISIIDEVDLKNIDRRRKAFAGLLSKFTFRLADGSRWMPHKARELFEKELNRTNEEGKEIIHSILEGNVDKFVAERKERLAVDIDDMYKKLGRKEYVSDGVIERITCNLKDRLTKAMSSNFVPELTYSDVSLNSVANNWSSPWGQALTLLIDIASFPRKALSNPFFLQNVDVHVEELVKAMNMLDDTLLSSKISHGLKSRCHGELKVINCIEKASIDAYEKCVLVYALIRGYIST